ncbi:MAG: nitrile hydratase subunit beta [Alphaproteobacteria bacterium]|nr:nitrile hydratase subunit beta [Alphaproteobacteria bacterium]
MNGVHDLGGGHGHGPVRPETHEPVFHSAWERQAMALTVAMGASGQWNIDQMRSARESLAPAQYLGLSYYQIWIQALCDMMLSRDLVTVDELRTGQMSTPASTKVRVLARSEVDAALRRGSPASRRSTSLALFAPGQKVRARQMHPEGHTRLPRYVRGHLGTIQTVLGFHVWPDHSAQHRHQPPGSGHEVAQWLYSVRFEGAELWGSQAEAGLSVCVDAWESYLEPA